MRWLGLNRRLERSAALRGVVDALLFPAWIVGLTMLSIGGFARDAGHPAGAAVLSTFLMWAGPAQLILYGGIATGAALPALSLAVSLSSVRFLPMTISVLPLVRRPGQSFGVQLLAAHYVAVTVWVHSLHRLPQIPVERRAAYYFGFANATLLVSCATTFAGHSLAPALPLGLAAGLLFLNPVFFIVSLFAGAQRIAERSTIVLGIALSPIFTILIGRDFDLIATGLVGGTAAYIYNRRTKGRRV